MTNGIYEIGKTRYNLKTIEKRTAIKEKIFKALLKALLFIFNYECVIYKVDMNTNRVRINNDTYFVQDNTFRLNKERYFD